MRAPLSLAELLAAADSGHVSFDHTLAAWIVRETAERVCDQGTVRLEPHNVAISAEGVRLTGSPPACDTKEAARALRGMLDQLLQRATSSTGALRLCACRLDATDVDMLIREIAFGGGPIDEARVQQTVAGMLDLLRAASSPAAPASAAAPVAPVVADDSVALGRLRAERDAAGASLEAMREARDKDARRMTDLVAERESVRLEGELRYAAARRELAAQQARIEELERAVADSERGVAAKIESAMLDANARARSALEAQIARVSALEAELAKRKLPTSLPPTSVAPTSAPPNTAPLEREIARLGRELERSLEGEENARRELETARAELSSLHGDLDAMRRDLAAARRELESSRRDHEIARRELERGVARSTEIQTHAQQRIASLEQELEEARKRADLADAAQHAAQQAAEGRIASLEERRTTAEGRTRVLEEMHARSESRAAEIERLAEGREAAHRDALLRLRNEAQSERTELVTAHAQTLAAERRRHGATLAEEQEKQRAQLDALERKLRDALLAAARVESPTHPAIDFDAELERRLADALLAHQVEIGAIQRQHESALAAAEEAASRASSALKRTHAEALAEKESRQRTAIERLELRVRTAEESALRASADARREAMQEATAARSEVLRDKDAVRLGLEQRHTRELQAAVARVQRHGEEEAARALDELRCAHRTELASFRAESESTRARLTARIDELEQDVFRALGERDAERSQRIDLEQSSARQIYALRGGPIAPKLESIEERAPEIVKPAGKKRSFVGLTGAALVAISIGAALANARRGGVAPSAVASPMVPVASPTAPVAACEAHLSLSHLRPGTEVLRRLGATPFAVKIPARKEHELLLTRAGAEPKRVLLEAGARWSDDAVPTLALDVQLTSRAELDPFAALPRRAGGPLRALLNAPPPGVLQVTSAPAAADVWLEIDPLESAVPCGSEVDLLLVAPLGSIDRARVAWSEFTGSPPRAIHRVTL